MLSGSVGRMNIEGYRVSCESRGLWGTTALVAALGPPGFQETHEGLQFAQHTVHGRQERNAFHI